MNLIHWIYSRSTSWRRHVTKLVPWALEGVDLCGAAVLELGSGPGLTTLGAVPGVEPLICPVAVLVVNAP